MTRLGDGRNVLLASDLRFDGPEGGYGSAGVPGVEESVGRAGAGKIRGLLLADIRNLQVRLFPNSCMTGQRTSRGRWTVVDLQDLTWGVQLGVRAGIYPFPRAVIGQPR